MPLDRKQAGVCLAVVVCLTLLSGGCRSRERQSETAPAPGSVGFELPGNASDAQGALRMPATEAGVTARDRCLAARAASGGLSGLPRGTRVTVQLALRAP
jgi:hypothetical protein